MPPAIHSTMTASAVGTSVSAPCADTARGKPAASADSVAALAVARKSRLVSRRSCQCTTWNSGSITMLQSRSSTPAAVGPRTEQLRSHSARSASSRRPPERALEHLVDDRFVVRRPHRRAALGAAAQGGSRASSRSAARAPAVSWPRLSASSRPARDSDGRGRVISGSAVDQRGARAARDGGTRARCTSVDVHASPAASPARRR